MTSLRGSFRRRIDRFAMVTGVAAGLLVTGCGSEPDAFSRQDAVALVIDETGIAASEAECIVGGMVDDGPFVPRDFLDDEDSDPRFASSFERIASECLL